MAYTDEQIQQVCDAGYEVMGHFTDVQNCTFPSAAIIAGMKAGKSSQEIANDAYDSIIDLPLRQTGYGLVGTGDTMHNVAMYMAGEVKKRIDALEEGTPEEEPVPSTD